MRSPQTFADFTVEMSWALLDLMSTRVKVRSAELARGNISKGDIKVKNNGEQQNRLKEKKNIRLGEKMRKKNA